MIMQAAIGLYALLLFGWTGSTVATMDNPEQGLPKIERTIPAPLPDHPGNIYLDGESVSIRVGPDIPQSAASWILFDDAHNKIKDGSVLQFGVRFESISVGELPIGWYRMEFSDAEGKPAGWTTAAVIKQLATPTPLDSPVCIDTAMAWFARDNASRTGAARQPGGAGRGELGPRPYHLEGHAAAARQDHRRADHLRSGRRYPVEGRDCGCCRSFITRPTGQLRPPTDRMRANIFRATCGICTISARRWPSASAARSRAWEPWNEANIEMFGGQTVDEMCSLQKAAYLGFKAGDPDVIVGWNVYTTLPTTQHTRGLMDNVAWQYYDTYNIHTYEWNHDYAELWGPAREATHGKPLWVTEADRGLPFETPGPWYEQSQENEMHKARYIAQAYACSLAAGCTRHFQFILGNFAEEFNHTQFGLLRKDFTPRPAYVVLAAVGRLLAGARFSPLPNDSDNPNPGVHAIAFDARPDGKDRPVIVLWAEIPVDWKDRNKTTSPGGCPTMLRSSRSMITLEGRSNSPSRSGVRRYLSSARVRLCIPKDGLVLPYPIESARWSCRFRCRGTSALRLRRSSGRRDLSTRFRQANKRRW